MNLEQAIEQLSRDNDDLPAEALQWCLDNWGGISAPMLERIGRYVEAEDNTQESLAAYAFYLAAEKRDRLWFAPLLSLARQDFRLDELLGDGVTEDLSSLVVSLFDGDLPALRTAILDKNGDDFVRAGLLEAHGALVLSGSIEREEATAWHFGAFERLYPRRTAYLWRSWAETAILFDPERALPLVRKAYARGWIDSAIEPLAGFEEQARDAKMQPALAVEDFLRQHAPIDGVVEKMAGWYCFSQAYRDERASAAEPAINAWKNVGRNDPCPCGSGRKFKKCCLGKAA